MERTLKKLKGEKRKRLRGRENFRNLSGSIPLF